MKKRFALLISMLIGVCVCSGIGAACAETNKSGEHKHTFSTVWSPKDAYSHWHAATCGHTDLGEDEEPHNIGDDYKCKVCGYTITPTEGLIHELNNDGKSYSIVGVDRYVKDVDIVIPLHYDGLPVTAIADGAFSEKSTLKSIRMPITVTSIGANAFYNCVNLTEANIPDYVTSIGEKAFYGCFSLECVSLGSSISSIGEDAFAECSNIKEVDIANLAGWCNIKLGNLNSSPFSGGADMYIEGVKTEDLVIPEAVTKLEQNVFGNLKLKSLTLPDSIVEIRNNAFYGFTVDSVKYTGNIVNWCKISFANNYATPLMTAESFYSNNQKITELVISKTESVGQYAFAGFKGLTSLSLYAVETVEDSAFSDCVNLTDLTISDSVISINNSAFSDCVNLKHIKFGDNVKYIGNNAFLNCRMLSEIILPNAVTSIGEGAFKSCTNLISVTLSEKLNDIGTAAFESCYKLVELYNLSLLKISIGTDSYGSAGLYALDIYNSKEAESKLVTSDGCIFYKGIKENYLLSYIGSSSNLILPDNLDGEDYGIYSYAFCYCDNLTKIVIPDSILSIGVSAFDNCESLTYNEYNNGLYLTLGSNIYGIFIKVKNKNETSMSIYDGARIIADSAFAGVAVTNITIPGSVVTVGDRAFENCANLSSVTLSNGLKSIGARAFYGCRALESLTVPDSVTSIGNSAFFSCTNLKKITLSDSLTYLGATPFEGCPIQEASIPVIAVLSIPKSYLITVNVTSGDKIEESAFINATKLKDISLPDSITYVGGNAFSGCTSLNYYEDENGTYLGNKNNHYLILIAAKDNSKTEYTLSEKTKIIYDNALYGFSALETINLEGIFSVGNKAFYNCSSIKNINLNDKATYIGDMAFYSCINLVSIAISDSVSYIGSQAFRNCSKLASIAIPKGVTKILTGTFDGCSALTRVTLHEDIEYIGNGTFNNCNNLSYNFYNGANYLGTVEKKYLYLIKISDDATSCTMHDDVKFVCLDAFNRSKITSAYVGTKSNPYLFLRKCEDATILKDYDGLTEYVGDYAFTTVSYSSSGSVVDMVGTFKNVALPNSIKYIGEDAFRRNLYSLTTVYIGGNVKRIESGAFDYCMNLSNIYFDGTYAQWKSITTSQVYDSNTSYHCGLILHCTDGDYKLI